MADVVEVAQAFQTYGYDLSDASEEAKQCLAICRQFGESADELALSWDAFRSSNAMKVSANPTAAAMEAFRSHFERYVASKRKTSAVKTPQAFYYDKPNLLEALESGDVDTDMVDASLAAITPGRGGNTPGAKTAAARAAHAHAIRGLGVQLPRADASESLAAAAPAPGASAFAKRPAPGAVKTELNAHLPAPVGAAKKAVAIEIVHAPGAGALTRDVRYMRDRISDKVDMLEQRLADFAAEVERRHPGLKCGGAVYAASQDDVTVVGRVVCDSEGRLNEASVQLEGSIATSNGMRVRLELRDLPRFSLFPGQIVCVQGQNPSGHCLVARRVIAAAPPPMPTSPVSSPAFGALSMAIASGPFTCAGDLAYEPFDALLAHCAATRPDAVVLLGPFVDADHKTIRGEDDSHPLEASFEEVFAFGVRDRLEKFLESSADAGYAPSVVLMPSTRDATHDAVFPQPPLLADGSVEAPAGVVVACAPNPGTFTVNGVRVMACTQDILRHLSAAEAARDAAPGGDRMARLVAHLPGQRSAYPLYPPAQGACVDAALAAHLTVDVTPDVMILPSDLNPFAKVVPREAAHAAAANAPPMADAATPAADDAFVAVNPGRLAKGNVGGTLARVYVAEGAPEPGKGGKQPHIIAKRARVDIVRV